MEKPEYTAKLEELNKELAALPVCDWKGTKVVTSGIIVDNPKLLEIFENNNIAIAADDVAHESRSFRRTSRMLSELLQNSLQTWIMISFFTIRSLPRTVVVSS